MFAEEEQANVAAAVKLTPTLSAKLERFARQTRRTRSQVLRLLLERAVIQDLDPRMPGRANGDGLDRA